MVVESGKLFMFGDNAWGQLGLSHTNPVQKPSRVKRKCYFFLSYRMTVCALNPLIALAVKVM